VSLLEKVHDYPLYRTAGKGDFLWKKYNYTSLFCGKRGFTLYCFADMLIKNKLFLRR
jgi:hypothetical protein